MIVELGMLEMMMRYEKHLRSVIVPLSFSRLGSRLSYVQYYTPCICQSLDFVSDRISTKHATHKKLQLIDPATQIS